MATISSLGVGSGIDAESIVSKLMTLEQQPLTALKTKETAVNTKISAYGSVSSLLDTLTTSLNKFKTTSGFAAYTATSSKEDVLTATASSTAGAGTYDIKVSRLATAHKLSTTIAGGSISTTIGSGSLGITVGTGSTVTVTAGAGATLGDWRDAINQANAGVTASIVNTSAGAVLTMTANDSGKAITLNQTSAPASLQAAFSTITAAQTAQYTIDGLDIESASNTDTTAIPGVTLNLKSVKTDVATTLTIGRNSSTTADAVKQFVSDYNALNSKIKSLTAYDSTNKKGNALTGDATVRNIQSQLTTLMGSSLSGTSGTYSRLADLGISYQKDGSLAVDSTKLDKAISTDFSSVSSVLTTYGTAMSDLTTGITKSGGILSQKTDSLNLVIKDYKARQDTLQLRLTAIEKRYRAQFSSLDTLVAGMQTTSTYLTQQLAKL